MASVKKKSAPSKSKLERAGERADDYVAGELVGVMKDMRGILKSSEDDRARVAAGSKLMDWARPKKPMNFGVQVNVPQIDSRLKLPSAPPTFAEVRQLQLEREAPRDVPKILPEAPRTLADSLRPFRRAELAPAELETPAPIAPLEANEREPDKPPSASSVKPFGR